MKKYLAVWREAGPNWNPALSMTEQDQWDEHAEFMEDLAADGFVVLGGPLDDGARILLVVEADSRNTVRERLNGDPWHKAGILKTARISNWSILQEASRR